MMPTLNNNEQQQQQLTINNDEDSVMNEPENVKRIKRSCPSNSSSLSQTVPTITPDQRATKLKKLETENMLLKERIANMEKLIQHQHNNRTTTEEQLLKNNRFGAIIENNDPEVENIADEDNQFETVKRAIKRKNVNATKVTPEKKVTPSKNNNPPKELKTNKPPPLHIHNQQIKDTIQLVKGAQIDSFEIRRVSNMKHSLIINNIENYNKMQNILKEVNTNYFTFTPKELKPKTIVLKGLNEDENIEEIKTSIENQGIKVTNVSQLKTKRSVEKQIKLPLYIIQCPPDTDMTRLYNIKSLNYQRISWENLKKKEGIMQCRKCQRYGHAATNCCLEYRCVKCSTQHKPGECQIKDTIEKSGIYCVNCDKTGHPASFKGCPTYQSALRRLKEKINEKHNHSTLPKLAEPIKVNSQHGTYAEVLKQSTSEQSTVQKLAARVEKMAAVIQQQSEQISQLLSMLNKL